MLKGGCCCPPPSDSSGKLFRKTESAAIDGFGDQSARLRFRLKQLMDWLYRLVYAGILILTATVKRCVHPKTWLQELG